MSERCELIIRLCVVVPIAVTQKIGAVTQRSGVPA
jgi:hypothetical protein